MIFLDDRATRDASFRPQTTHTKVSGLGVSHGRILESYTQTFALRIGISVEMSPNSDAHMILASVHALVRHASCILCMLFIAYKHVHGVKHANVNHRPHDHTLLCLHMLLKPSLFSLTLVSFSFCRCLISGCHWATTITYDNNMRILKEYAAFKMTWSHENLWNSSPSTPCTKVIRIDGTEGDCLPFAVELQLRA